MSASRHPTGEVAAVLDLGTARTSCWVGDAELVLGHGEAASEGVRAGEVVDPRAASWCVRTAVTEAERVSGLRISGLCAAVSGGSVEGRLSRSAAPILREGQEILGSDVRSVLDRAADAGAAACFSRDAHGGARVALHVLPRRFWVDGRGPLRDPVGLSGALLQAEVVVVSASEFALENLSRAIRLAGYCLRTPVAAPVAAGLGALSEEERELGALVLDIGAGATSYSVWTRGRLLACGCVPVGGERVTRDIAVGLGVPMESAEGLKRAWRPGPSDERLRASSLGGGEPRSFTRLELTEIAEARVEEIVRLVLGRLAPLDLRELGAGIVLAGGAGGNELALGVAREIVGLDARPARVGAEELSGPECALAAGLLAWSTTCARDAEVEDRTSLRARASRLARAFRWLAAGF